MMFSRRRVDAVEQVGLQRAGFTYEEVMAILNEERDAGAYDGARPSLGRRRLSEQLDPNINVLTDLFDFRRDIYNYHYDQAKAQTEVRDAAQK